MLNRPFIINDDVTDHTEQENINHEMDISPQKSEVKKAIDWLLTDKAPGADAIPAKINKAGGTSIINKLTEVFQSFWDKGKTHKTSRIYIHHSSLQEERKLPSL